MDDSHLLIARCRYAEVRSLYVDQLACIWKMDLTEAVRVRVEGKINSFVEGDLDHATEILSALWKTANEDGLTTTPWTPSQDVSSLFICFLPRATRGAYST
jgi:hypothetical protein